MKSLDDLTKEPADISNYFLLPNKTKIIGWILFVTGAMFAVLRFYFQLRFPIFEIKTFAVYSSYFETKYFSIIENNFNEEIIGLLLLLGIFLLALSKEKTENNQIALLRLRAFIISLYFNTLFLVFALLFVFGLGFVKVMILNLFSFPLFYLIIFRYYIIRYKTLTSAAEK